MKNITLGVILLVAMLHAIHLSAQSRWKTRMNKGNPPPGIEKRWFQGPSLFLRDMSIGEYNRARKAMSIVGVPPNGRYFHSTWVAGFYFNYYDNVRTIGLTGEYYFHRDFYVSANVGYRDLEYSGDFVRFLEFEGAGNYHFGVINNVVFLTALAGINTSTIDLSEVETSLPDYRMLANLVLGGELMVRLGMKWFAFTDFRQLLALNASDNNGGLLWLQVWSLGVKRSIKF